MSVYAIGDVQGCLDELQRLLDKIKFDATSDTLWFAGDLVNRGQQSLETLRFIKSLGTSAVSVLGNHDLHLLALANHHPKFTRRTDLHRILEAPDTDELINWLRHQKIMHSQFGFHLVHAGIYPFWDTKFAQQQANKLTKILRSEHYADFILQMYSDMPILWRDDLNNIDELRFITNSFTRMRYLQPNGSLDFKQKGDVNTTKLTPWFELNKNRKIIFGHWSTLSKVENNQTYAIDTGCVWGRQLTAFCLEGDICQIKC